MLQLQSQSIHQFYCYENNSEQTSVVESSTDGLRTAEGTQSSTVVPVLARSFLLRLPQIRKASTGTESSKDGRRLERTRRDGLASIRLDRPTHGKEVAMHRLKDSLPSDKPRSPPFHLKREFESQNGRDTPAMHEEYSPSISIYIHSTYGNCPYHIQAAKQLQVLRRF